MSGEGLIHVEADLTAEEMKAVRFFGESILAGPIDVACRKLLASIPKPPRRLTYDDLLDMSARQIVGVKVVDATGGHSRGVVARTEWQPHAFTLTFLPGGSLTLYPGDWADVEDPS